MTKVTLKDEYKNQALWRNWTKYLHHIPIISDNTVLDLGCGIGSITRLLSGKVAKVIGIDNNPDLLNEAKLSNMNPNIEYIKCDLRHIEELNLPLADGIWSSFVAAYFPDFEPILSSWIKLLKPGGWIALTEMSGLFDHEPLTTEAKTIFKNYYKRQREGNIYDFEMGSRLKNIVSNLNLKIIMEKDMDDPELNFSGPAEETILKAWSDRFGRMYKFSEFLGKDSFKSLEDEFLKCIQMPGHISKTQVKFITASKQ